MKANRIERIDPKRRETNPKVHKQRSTCTGISVQPILQRSLFDRHEIS